MKKIQSIVFLVILSLFMPLFSLHAVAPTTSGSTSGACTGEILTDEASARACGDKAVAQGTSLGYKITCDTQKSPLLTADPNTGLTYYWSTDCTVNGVPGFGAYTLAGLDNSKIPTCTVSQLAEIVKSGKATGFTSQGCRAPSIEEGGCVVGAVGNPTGACALIDTINAGWAILQVDLAREKNFVSYASAKASCGKEPFYDTKINQYVCNNPNPPLAVASVVGNGVPASTSTITNPNGDIVRGCTSSTGVSSITGLPCAGTSYVLDKDGDGIPDNVDDNVDFPDNSVKNVVFPNSNGTGSSAGTSSQSCAVSNSGIKTGAFRYTFTKSTNDSWVISLNNPAYSVGTDIHYVPANYSIVATSAAELNIRNQGRFNHLDSLPGTADGNKFYDNMFGSYINAYYDWDNMTKGSNVVCVTTSTASPTPTSSTTITTSRTVDSSTSRGTATSSSVIIHNHSPINEGNVVISLQSYLNGYLKTNLVQDGKVGVNTLGAVAQLLTTACFKNINVSKVDTQDEKAVIQELQKSLNSVLKTDLTLDGKLGPKTLEALSQLKSNNCSAGVN